jgi:tRNA wybutosine-synthesizing protein 4
MRKKADIINEEPKLRDLLGVGGLDRPETGFLHSENYIAIGCDLYDLPTLKQALSEEFTGQQCMFLLVAEVSITYMETPNADALIAWAACLGDGILSTRTHDSSDRI